MELNCSSRPPAGLSAPVSAVTASSSAACRREVHTRAGGGAEPGREMGGERRERGGDGGLVCWARGNALALGEAASRSARCFCRREGGRAVEWRS